MRKVFKGIVFGMSFNLAVKGFKLHATCIKSGGMTKVIIVIIIMLGGVFSDYMFMPLIRLFYLSNFPDCLFFSVCVEFRNLSYIQHLFFCFFLEVTILAS